MPGLVTELQQAAAHGDVPIADLLRRAKLVAVKLKQTETARWIDHELNGYESEVPDYRKAPTRVVYHNMFHGWQPVLTDNPKINETISSPRPIIFPAREIEELAHGKNDDLYMTLPPNVQMAIAEWGVPGQVSSELSRSSLIGILDVIRTRVLDWALQLEANEIFGEGMSFTSEEKRRSEASGAQITIHGGIGNFAGILGTASGETTVVTSQVNPSIDVKAVRRLLTTLREQTASLPIDDRSIIEDASQNVDDALDEPGVGQTRLRRALRSLRNMLPKLATWGAKTMIEAEITHFIGK